MWDIDGGVYFGHATNATEEGARPKIGREIRYVGDRHIITIGPNGSGKSRRVLLPNLAQLKGWSIVVVDPKGDLCQMTREYRETHGAKSVILNPFGVLDLESHGFNPVAALDDESDDFPDDAFGLAESMIRVEGNEPHWSASAQDLVAGLIMAVRLTLPPKPQGQEGPEEQEVGSLAHVREMLGYDYERFKTNILNLIEVAKIKKCPELEAKLSRFSVIDNESRELNSILSTAQTQTRWLDSRPIKVDLGKGAFDFSRLKEQPTTVYLTLPARRLGTHATWLRVMIASIIQPLLKDTRKPKVPVLLVLDEYPALAAGGFAVIEKKHGDVSRLRNQALDGVARPRASDQTLWQRLGIVRRQCRSSAKLRAARRGDGGASIEAHALNGDDGGTAQPERRRAMATGREHERSTHAGHAAAAFA